MQEYIIRVNEVEELQTLRNIDDLERIFQKAKSTIVQGESVVLVRANPNGNEHQVDQLTTENELNDYRQKVFRYL